MHGDGLTKKEAYSKLKEKFDSFKLEGRALPRPGSKVRITYAEVSRIDSLEAEAILFFRAVFDMDYYGMFISDQSSMYDFCWSDDLLYDKKMKIQEEYGIELNDLDELKIVDILERIKLR